MIRPDKNKFPLSQLFGQNKNKFSYGPKGHDGVDIAAPTGSSVYAPRKGVVVDVNFNPDYGLRIKINNGKNIDYVGHLSQSLVQVGQKVKEGQLIAKSGASGNVTGPHIHWGVYSFNTGHPTDPLREVSRANKTKHVAPKPLPPKAVYYTVKRRNYARKTLSKIAKMFSTTTAHIKKLNPKLADITKLDVGAKVRIK